MSDLEMFAEDAIWEVFVATVKGGAPVSFETAYKYIIEGEPGIWKELSIFVSSPFNGDTNIRSSSVFKGYCKRYWNVELEKYVNWLVKEAA